MIEIMTGGMGVGDWVVKKNSRLSIIMIIMITYILLLTHA